ncbi:MAG: putative rane protein [Haloplasmataceae bacterium]|jgi:hypothetical protein|nr:putative rane protein [Haloplasmataceae bacterium]
MQKIFEPIFHVLYLSTVITIGLRLYNGNKNNVYFKLFGLMSIVLGFGDAFHLLPRIYALLTTGLENNVAILGFGKLVTSITMTIFYLMLYKIWKIKFNKNYKWLDYLMLILTSLRIGLCQFPQNEWFSSNPPLSWGILRNIPFMIMGLIMIYLLFIEGKRNNNKKYINMSIAVVLSFLFYAPVVLFAQDIPLLGMLMIPKTLAYVWIVYIGYSECKSSKNKAKIAA